jgi:O-antigen ligase
MDPVNGAQDSLMISASLPGWQRAAGALQVLTVAAFAIVLMRPLDVPDPLSVGHGLSWSLVCLAAAVAVIGVELFAGGWPSTGLDRPLLAYVALVGLTTITSVDRSTTLVWIVSLAGNIGIFAAIVVAARKTDWLADALLLFLVADIALLLLLATGYHAEVGFLARPKGYPIPEGWSGYPELSMLGALQFGLLVAAMQMSRSWTALAVAATLAVVTVAEIGLLYARGAWLAIVAVVVVAGAFLVRQGHRRRVIVGACLAAALALGLAVTNPTLRHLLTAPGNAVIDGKFIEVATPQMRVRLWTRTLRMIADHPFAGVGLGNFRSIFEKQYNPELNEDGRRGVHAHNLWLHQYAELGIAGGTAYLLLWATIAVMGWRQARARPGFRTFALLLALVAIGASNLTTYMFHMPGFAAGRLHSLTWLVFGLIAANLAGEENRHAAT